MSNKKSRPEEGQAVVEIRPLSEPVSEEQAREEPVAEAAPLASDALAVVAAALPAGESSGASETPSEPAAEPVPEPKTVMEHARDKGHIPPKGPYKFRTDPHRGRPNYLVVLAHTGWPPNQLVSEAAYDEAVVAAYSISVGESR